MPTFRQWFTNNVSVGPYPTPAELEGDGRLATYEVVINVSDEYQAALAQTLLAQGKAAHWFPLGEFWGLSLGSIYGALFILWQAEQRQQWVYLHCHAGVNRSQTVADSYYFLRTGKHRSRKAWARGPATRNALQRNCDNYALPTLPQMEAWLRAVGYSLTHPQPGWLDACHEQVGLPNLYAASAPPRDGAQEG